MGGRWVSRGECFDGALDWASRDQSAREDYAQTCCSERGCRRRTSRGAAYCFKHAPRRPEENLTSEH